MNIAKKLATQLLKTHKSVESVRKQMQAKLALLLETRPAYVLFDLGITHPYYGLENLTERFSEGFNKLSSVLLNLTVESSTVGDEVDKIVTGCDADAAVHAFFKLHGKPVTSITALSVGRLLEDVYGNAIFVRSYIDRKAIEVELLKLFDKKQVEMRRASR